MEAGLEKPLPLFAGSGTTVLEAIRLAFEEVVAAVVVAVEAAVEVAVAADVAAAVAFSQALEGVVDVASFELVVPLTRRWSQWRRPFAPALTQTLPLPHSQRCSPSVVVADVVAFDVETAAAEDAGAASDAAVVVEVAEVVVVDRAVVVVAEAEAVDAVGAAPPPTFPPLPPPPLISSPVPAHPLTLPPPYHL